jgi:hypothetical protein
MDYSSTSQVATELSKCCNSLWSQVDRRIGSSDNIEDLEVLVQFCDDVVKLEYIKNA